MESKNNSKKALEYAKQTVRFESIQSIYIVMRGLQKRKGRTELLKIRTKTNKKIYISLSVLNKKEEKELKRIFKEGIGKKVREKYEFRE